MNVLTRIFIFIGCFVVISFGCFLIGGAVSGVMAVREAANPATAQDVARAAGMEFGVRYGIWIYAFALISAGGIAFRWYGAMFFALVCGAVYAYGDLNLQQLRIPLLPSSPQSAVTTGSRVRLLEPVTVTLPYGKMSIPAGAEALVIGQDGDSLQLKVHTGQTVVVSKDKVR